jgi:integrase/recombinase XerD
LLPTPKTAKTTTSASVPVIGPLLDSKVEEITAGLQKCNSDKLRSISEYNAAAIIEYITAMKSEVNPSNNYRRDLIEVLSRFSRYIDNKAFKQSTRTDIIGFLESYRKTEVADPMHKWIGTYNLYRIHLIRFFRWLHSPDIEPDKRPKPSVVENIPKLKRKEKSVYKPSDLWTQQDDLLFLKYCPSKRDKCYHAISRDTSCRPHEIIKLKIRDIVFKTTGNYQYAEALVNGKTGSRPIPLIDSIPYLKDYLDHEHPQPGNPNAPLICGTGRGLGRHICAHRVIAIYFEYKKHVFPKLLESPNVLPEDKQKIAELLKKPWNPYIRRHSALTEKSTVLKEHVLRQHAGWSGSSQMHLKYLHYFGNESNESLLEAYGIVASGQQIDQLRPKQCPNCNEPNKPDSKFCAKCRMVLSYDAYSETVDNKQEGDDAIATLSDQVEKLMAEVQELKNKSPTAT